MWATKPSSYIPSMEETFRSVYFQANNGLKLFRLLVFVTHYALISTHITAFVVFEIDCTLVLMHRVHYLTDGRICSTKRTTH